jgi:hypothetical protein
MSVLGTDDLARLVHEPGVVLALVELLVLPAGLRVDQRIDHVFGRAAVAATQTLAKLVGTPLIF